MLDAPTVGMLGTVAGIGLVVSIVEEIILRAWNPPAATKDRFGPLLALILGIVFAVAGFATSVVDDPGGAGLLGALLLGIVSAGAGMGIHDTTTAVAPDSP